MPTPPPSSPTASLSPLPTRIAGRYAVQRALGRGSFGHTFLARDTDTGRQVAIKVLDPTGAQDLKSRELFEREAAVLRGLRHAGIPAMHELLVAEWRGATRHLLVMEYIEGESLAERIESRVSLSRAQIVEILVELFGILAYLHECVPPILHRDVKPANIVLRPNGMPVLVDFGSVRSVFLSAEEGGSTIAGSYGYMPYEQYMGQASPASDLFSLAATMLHVLTGRPPRDFMNEDGHIVVPADLPAEPRVRQLLSRLLQPARAHRFATAREARAALLAGDAGTADAGDAGHVTTVMPTTTRTGTFITPPVPVTLERIDELTPTMWEYMDSAARPSDGVNIGGMIALVAVSVVTLGVYPLTFWLAARSRRRMLTRFIAEGEPHHARINRIESDELAFAEKIALVHFSFERDGHVCRGSDRVLLSTAHRWEAGDQVEIRYLADVDDSVIVSGR